MLYQIYASVFASLFILSIFTVIILNLERKRNLYKEHIFRRVKNNVEKFSDFSSRLLGPVMPSKEKLNTLRHYLYVLSLKGITPEKIYIYSFGSAILSGVFYFTILYFISPVLGVAGAIIGTFAGYRLPIILIKSRYETIQKEKQMGILPYVEMLQVACEAGLTLTIAIERVYDYYPTPLSLEFKKANNDFMTNIKTRKESLSDIISRVGGDDIRLLIETIIQSLDTGTPIKTVLKTLSGTIRRELRKSIIDRGQKAKWRNFVVSLVFQFPPYIFIIAGPSFMSLVGSLN